MRKDDKMQTWFLDFVANIKIKETGIVMDTFIDKLAQKKNAQEMIRANSAAEAVKMDQMQKQMKAYDELMQEIRRVNKIGRAHV